MIKITTDSTCDLPERLLEQYDITVFPLGIVKAGKLYHDARDAGCPEATPSPPSSSPRPAIAAVRFAAPKTPPSSLTTSSFSL